MVQSLARGRTKELHHEAWKPPRNAEHCSEPDSKTPGAGVRSKKDWLGALVQLLDRPKDVVAMGLHVDACPDLPHNAVRIDQERVTRGKFRDAEIHHRVVFFGYATFRIGEEFKGQALP